MTHKAMKFRVKNPDHSKAIQERLFEMGYKWFCNGKKVSHQNAFYLVTTDYGNIEYGTSLDRFIDSAKTETTLEEITEWTPKQGEMIEVETQTGKWSTRNLIMKYNGEFLCELPNGGFFSYSNARPINPIRREIEELKARLNELEAKL